MDSERTRKDGAGCLVLLGIVGLLPVFFALWIFGGEALREARSILGAIQWTGVASLWQTLLRLIRYDFHGEIWSGVLLLFAIVYPILLWQWVMVLFGWRTLISERRVWALSSGYFLAVILFLGCVCHQALGVRQPEIEDSPASNQWSWLVAAIALSTIPSVYLSITMPLWLSTPRGPADPNARSH